MLDRLVIIDGNAILHRAFHALPPLTTKNGELVNAVFGFTSMLLRVAQDLKPAYLVVTFDRPKPTFRKSLYVGYQAKRPKMDEGLSAQIERVHQVVACLGIPIYEMDGYEADDVIGTITNKTRKSHEVIIVTGDRDILQLVDGNVKAYMPVKGLSEAKLFGEKEVEDKFGIKPGQIVDYKALVGDASDNYPGVAGVGPKTASGLLSRFKTLEQTYTHIGEIESEKVRRALAENSEQAGLAKKLATIVTDVPITFDIEKCRLKNLDRPHIHKLFEDLEFRSLIPRLGEGSKMQPFDRTQGKSGKDAKKDIVKEEKRDTSQQIKLF